MCSLLISFTKSFLLTGQPIVFHPFFNDIIHFWTKKPETVKLKILSDLTQYDFLESISFRPLLRKCKPVNEGNAVLGS